MHYISEGSPKVPPASHGCIVCAVHWLPVEAEPASRVSSPSMKHRVGKPRQAGPVWGSKVVSLRAEAA